MNNRFYLKIGAGRCCVVVLLVFFTGGLCAGAGQGLTEGIPDPGIIKSREDGCYYIFCTGRGIPIHRSKDLVEWQRVGRVFEGTVPDWAATEVPGSRNIWAPDIAYFNGKYHLYYSISTFGSQRSCIGPARKMEAPCKLRGREHHHNPARRQAQPPGRRR